MLEVPEGFYSAGQDLFVNRSRLVGFGEPIEGMSISVLCKGAVCCVRVCCVRKMWDRRGTGKCSCLVSFPVPDCDVVGGPSVGFRESRCVEGFKLMGSYCVGVSTAWGMWMGLQRR